MPNSFSLPPLMDPCVVSGDALDRLFCRICTGNTILFTNYAAQSGRGRGMADLSSLGSLPAEPRKRVSSGRELL
jgi:hypothetical protein